MKRLVTLLTLSCTVALGAIVFVPSASADPVPVGGPVASVAGLWQEFSFLGPGSFGDACTGCTPSSAGNSEYAPDPPWTFFIVGPKAGNLTVVDAFLIGDTFQVYDFGIPLGETSWVPAAGSCGSNPEDCLWTASTRVYSMAPGPHSITIQAVLSPFGSGAAYFRVRESSCGAPAPVMAPCLASPFGPFGPAISVSNSPSTSSTSNGGA